MGKTSLAKLVEEAAPRNGWTVVRQSVEGYRSLDELTDSLLASFERFENSLQRVARTFINRATLDVHGVGIAPAASRRRFENVVVTAVQETDHRLLLILDELPLFARELNRRDPGANEGTAALHLLRRLRETHEGLRMLCLGSVGFHHVVRDASGVLNDTVRVRLAPLSCARDGDAEFLARCLLRGAELAPDHETAVARHIASEVEGVPYYVHKVVEAAEKRPRAATLDERAVKAIVAGALTEPDDPWDLRHYRDRIDPYYDGQADLACAVLDAIAYAETAVDLKSLMRILAANPEQPTVSPDLVRDVLERLVDDHYLVRRGDVRVFAFSLVRRAWIEQRR